MAKTSVDLTNIFETVAANLAANQAVLDQADDYNHDHGSNMVQTFQTISGALEKKKSSSDSAKLAYAAKTLSKQSASGSGKLYAEHLNQAARQFKGKKVDEKGALDLLGTLIGSAQGGQAGGMSDLMGALLGGGQSSGGSGGTADLMGALLGGGQSSGGGGTADLMGALLGGMTGQETQQQSQPQQSDDLLGALLGGVTGSSQNTSQNTGAQGGLGVENLLAAGMAFMQAKQSGGNNMQALVQAFAAGSGMGSASHREQSTQVVVQSFLQALGGVDSKR